MKQLFDLVVNKVVALIESQLGAEKKERQTNTIKVPAAQAMRRSS